MASSPEDGELLLGNVIHPYRVDEAAALDLEHLIDVEVQGRKVALLLAPDADRGRAARVCGNLTSRAITATVLEPHLSQPEKATPDIKSGSAMSIESKLPAGRPIGVACSMFYDGIVLLGECSPWLAKDAHARTFVGDAYRVGKPVGVVAPSPDQTLATLARLGHDVPPHEDPGLVVDSGPRAADDDFDDDFTAHFLEALALHRFLGR